MSGMSSISGKSSPKVRHQAFQATAAGDAEFRDVGNGALPCGESGPRGQSRAALPSHRARAESTGCLEGWELGMKKMSKSPSEGNRKLHVFQEPI